MRTYINCGKYAAHQNIDIDCESPVRMTNSIAALCILRYVLLKERNMVMTMKQAHDYEREPFANPERLDKVQKIVPHQYLL